MTYDRFADGAAGPPRDPGPAATGAGPIDMSITPDGLRLFTLDGPARQLSNFAVRADGSLEADIPTTGLPMGANGMAAW
jgi:hypothetical protein